MASEPPQPVNPRFSFGSTVSDMFGAIGGHWLVMCGLALLFAGLPNAAFTWFWLTSFMDLATGGSPIDPGWVGRRFGLAFAGFAVAFVVSIIAQTAITEVALRHFQGQRIGFGSAIGAGFRHFLRVFAIMLIYYFLVALICFVPFFLIGVVAGTAGGSGPDAFGAIFGLLALMFLIIVPLLFLMTVLWIAAIPAAMQERLGPIAALGRSQSLTRGHRWKLVAMVLIYFVLLIIFSIALNAITTGSMAFTPTSRPDQMFRAMMPMFVLQGFLGSLTLVLTHPAVAATYANLRKAKEGVWSDTVADVFG